MQILKELPADSPAAAQLDAVIQLRLNGYLGRPPLRLGNAAVFVLLLGAAVTWMALELGSAKTTGDFAVYGAGAGFFGGMLLQVGLSVATVYSQHRRATAGEAAASAAKPETEPEPEPEQREQEQEQEQEAPSQPEASTE